MSNKMNNNKTSLSHSNKASSHKANQKTVQKSKPSVQENDVNSKEVIERRKERQTHIEEIWKVFAKANEQQRKKLIEELDDETVTELRARGNPFSQSALYKKNKGNRILLFSLFSPHEKYLDRFSMTSLIGFLFRMLDEYVPEEAKQYMSESEPQFVKAYETHFKKFMREKPSSVLGDELNTLNKQLENANVQLADLQAKANKEKNTDGDDVSDDEDEIKARSDKISELQVELADIDRKVMENAAKTFAYKIGIFTTQIEEMQPMLKSLTKDFERNRDVRKNLKQYLRLLLEEKVEAKKRETPNEEQAAALQLADATATELQNDNDGDVLESKKKSNKPKKQRAGTTVPADDKRPIRALVTILEDIRNNKAKLDASTVALEESTKKLDAHKAHIADLTTAMDAQRKGLDDLQRQYYTKYIKPTMKASKKDSAKKPNPAKVKQAKPINEDYKKAFAHLEVGGAEDLTPEEDYYIKESVKKELGIEKTQEECSDSILDNIEEFLYEYLVFNPDNHVKSAYKPNYRDPTRTPLKVDKKSGMIVDETFERKLIPPIDTFKRWERYREANYEELRQATDDIYSEKSDFEWAIIPLEVFEGQDAKERAEEWERKHAKEVDLSIRSVNFNEISLLGPWEQNRENYNYYTKETEILKRMIDTHKEEERFANQMTKDRMRKKKEENQEEMGNDDQGLNDYLQAHPTGIEKYGAKRALTAKDIPRDDNELPDDEVQIEVVNLGAKRVGRRWKPTSEKWKFHVPAEPLKGDNIVTHTPAEFHKEQSTLGNGE
jgi:hypothetical protein